MPEHEGFAPTEVCIECKGKCCKRYAGIYSPEEIAEPMKETILKNILEGLWAIDSYETGDEDDLGKIYFIRPKHTNASIGVDFSWGGTCVFLHSNGCSLEFKNRPYQCRMLEPRKKECIAHGSNKKAMAVKWAPFQQIIIEVLYLLGLQNV